MEFIIKAFRLFFRDPRFFVSEFIMRYLSIIITNDILYLKLLYYFRMGKPLHLKRPITFNEKLNWLKLYDRKPEYTLMVDKYAVKSYVAGIIGKEYIIPTLAVWNKLNDIDWNKLPDQFVLKTTHGGGGDVIICKDKNSFDKRKAVDLLNKSLRKDIYRNLREWPYKNVPKRIIAEKYMTNNGEELMDFKVHNFNGVPKFILVCQNRYKDVTMTENFYTVNWELLNMKRPNHPNSTTSIEKPSQLQDMLELSKKLSRNLPFLRTDFYIIDGKVYFGELTFYPAGGMRKFEPEEWDYVLGEWLDIPKHR